MQFWDRLSDDERKSLCQDISEINIEEVCGYFKRATESMTESQEKLDDRLKPIPSHLYGAFSRTSRELLLSYENAGLREISEGKVGVILMAGGQGTRLGSSNPKGMYDVGLPSRKSLYQIQGERIRRVVELAFEKTAKRGRITWIIMTSEHTKEPTLKFFEKHNFFGLNRDDVIMFEQGLLPCFTFDGKIILDKLYKVSRAPDGNGGLYRALRDLKVLDELERRGVKYLHAHSVDNILVKVADPVFIGYCIKKGADCAVKVVEKAFPSEALGVICKVDSKFQVVEYSEITQKTAELRNNDGRLTFNAGNICNHYFTLDFLKKIAEKHENELTLHIAKKKIPYINSKGNLVIPDKPNGIKMEKFVFDVFPFCENLVVWEVNREEEFSALKNADGADKDTPTTARKDIYSLHKKYIRNAGGDFDNDSSVICEISPLLSYAGEGLESIVKGKIYKSPVLLKSDSEILPVLNGNSH